MLRRRLLGQIRRYATEAPQATSQAAPPAASQFAPEPPARTATILMLCGALGLSLGTYLYLSRSEAPFAENPFAAKPKLDLKPALNPNEFVQFPLKSVLRYNHNTSRFIFELPPDAATLLPVAACVIVKADDLNDAKGKPIIRPYTPISSSNTPGELELLVKKYDGGNASKYIHAMKPGDMLSFKGPIPKWPFKVNEFDEVALIGGGSGITPLHQILTFALGDKTNKTKFKLLFANVSEPDILLKEEFDAMKRKFPDTFDVVYIVDKPSKTWTGATGYITSDLLKQHLASPDLGEKVKVFICGPPPQVAALSGKKDGMKQGQLGGVLKELGYKDDQVYKF